MLRLSRLHFFAVCALAWCLQSVAAHAAGIAFVVNSGGASISVVDMATQKEVRRIPALREPHHLMLSPDGRSLLVGDTTGNQMMFLDPTRARSSSGYRCLIPISSDSAPTANT